MSFYDTFMELTEDVAVPQRAAAYPEPEEGTLDHLSNLFIEDPGGVDAALDQIEQTVNSDPYLAFTQCSFWTVAIALPRRTRSGSAFGGGFRPAL